VQDHAFRYRQTIFSRNARSRVSPTHHPVVYTQRRKFIRVTNKRKLSLNERAREHPVSSVSGAGTFQFHGTWAHEGAPVVGQDRRKFGPDRTAITLIECPRSPGLHLFADVVLLRIVSATRHGNAFRKCRRFRCVGVSKKPNCIRNFHNLIFSP